MTFQRICLAASFLYAILTAILFAFPEAVYFLFGLQGNELGDFLARRAGALFLGFSVLSFGARNTTSFEVKALVSISLASAMAVMAILGICELIRGFAGAGILVAISIETVLAGLFFRQFLDAR